MAKTIFFSVGEPSGDLHGANLIRSFQRRGDNVRAVGFGGPRMAGAGADLLFDLTQLAVMGFIEVFWKLPKFFRLKALAEKYFAEHRPDAVVLIDFPGFNWHIAKVAKKHGIPVFYYGTPQVWGWAGWRVKKLRAYVDHALCKLPFEEAWLRERGVNATYVGHPYFDELHSRMLDKEFVAEHTDQKHPLVTLLPGSRTQEVRGNFHWQLEAMKKIRRRVPEARFAVAAFKEKHVAMAEEAIRAAGMVRGEGPTIYVGKTPELIEAATCCLAVSGSVSLELLHHAKPTVILYHVSSFAYWLQSLFRRVPYITLVNLLTAPELFPDKVGVYDRRDAKDSHVLMPEYLTYQDKSDDLAHHAVQWLNSKEDRTELVERMTVLKNKVAVAGASERAAEYVLRELGLSTGVVQRHDKAA